MIRLGVSLHGNKEAQRALSSLKISIQKSIVASAVRSAAGPIAVDLRKQLRQISRASPRGTGTLAKNIITKISRSRTGKPTIQAVTGAKRREKGPIIRGIHDRRVRKHRLRKPLPDQPDEGKTGLKAPKLDNPKFRVPTRYFHFLERGFTNWQTGRRIPPKAPMRIALHRNRTASMKRFEDTLWRGIIRESLRGNSYTYAPSLSQG